MKLITTIGMLIEPVQYSQNLIRNDLTELERGEHLKRRKKILLIREIRIEHIADGRLISLAIPLEPIIFFIIKFNFVVSESVKPKRPAFVKFVQVEE